MVNHRLANQVSQCHIVQCLSTHLELAEEEQVGDTDKVHSKTHMRQIEAPYIYADVRIEMGFRFLLCQL